MPSRVEQRMAARR